MEVHGTEWNRNHKVSHLVENICDNGHARAGENRSERHIWTVATVTCSEMDSDALVGHLFALLGANDGASLCSYYGEAIWMEQDGVWTGVGYLLSGLLLETSNRRPCDKIGGERVLIMSSWAVMTAVTPLLVNMGFPPLITIIVHRFLNCCQMDWVFNVIPWIVALPSSFFGSCMSDYLIREGFGTATVRKLMQFCSMELSSVFIYLLCKSTTFLHAVVFVSAIFGQSTFNSSGVAVNVHDLAPSRAGALFGIMNPCAAFTSLLMVYISGYLIEVTGSWFTVFGQLIFVNFAGVAVFLIFGNTKQVNQVNQTPVTFI